MFVLMGKKRRNRPPSEFYSSARAIRVAQAFATMMFFVMLFVVWSTPLAAQGAPANATDHDALKRDANGIATPGGMTAGEATKIDTQNSTAQSARFDSFDEAGNNVTLTKCGSTCDGAQLTLKVPPDRVQDFKNLLKDDRVLVAANSQSVVQTIKLTGRPVGTAERLWVVLGALIACLLAGAILTWWHPLQLIIGEDKRYSNSKFQMAIWFYVVIASYVAVLFLRVTELGWDFWGGVNIPSNVLLLSGMSALTFAGAKGITTAKVDSAVAQGNPNPKPSGTPSFWRDLLQNDVGMFDLGDFQMFVVTLLAVAMYLTSVFHYLGLIQTQSPTTLPDVDTTILATFGLGQGAYLTKKAVGNVGQS